MRAAHIHHCLKDTGARDQHRRSARKSRCCSRTSSAFKLDRLRLRGPNGARDEFILAATAQNLRKMAKLIPMPTPRLA
ncbi:transposase [Bradyrhizobium zhanjiangense]|uniref:transposase n=1 Tax=Bradyrhizobium zhanjiangense TaxID=1325107 RepID=UPI003D316CF8